MLRAQAAGGGGSYARESGRAAFRVGAAQVGGSPRDGAYGKPGMSSSAFTQRPGDGVPEVVAPEVLGGELDRVGWLGAQGGRHEGAHENL